MPHFCTLFDNHEFEYSKLKIIDNLQKLNQDEKKVKMSYLICGKGW